MKNNFQSKSVPRGTRTIWRYLGALILFFALSIGQMWGTATNFHDFVAAGDTIIDIEGTGSTPSTKMSTINGTDWAAVSTSAKNNSIYRMNPSTEEVATSKTNVYGTKLGSSAKSTYKVTGVSNVIFYVGTSSAGRTAYLDVTENGKSKVSEAASVTLSDKNNAYKMSYTLDASKSYTLEAYASSDIFCYAVKFTVASKCTKPGTPTALAAGSVTHNSASLSWTAGANNDGHKIYIEKKSDKTKVLDWTDATSPYAASGLDPETTYTFKVKAKGATGYCDFGDEASADFTTDVDPSATTYKVTLVPAGGTITDATGWTLNAGNYEREVSDGAELTLPAFTKTNRTFKTWRKSGPVDVTSPITVTADVTLTAVWTATVEQVLYSWEGGSPATEVGGTAVTKAQDGSDAETSDINVDAIGTNATYKAIKVQGKISSNAWSGNYIQITTDEAVKTGDKVKITACTTKGDTSKKGSAQIRVGTSATGTQIVSDGGTYNDIAVASDVPVPNTKTFTITATEINTNLLSMTRQSTNTNCWVTKLQIVRETQVEEGDLLTVTFDANGGSAIAPVVVASGQAVAKPTDPTWAHHRFNEWQLGGVAYDFDDPVTADITLVADWTQLYTISFAAGDGSGDAPAAIADKAKDETFEVPANTFTAPASKEFDKWNDGTNDYAPGATYTVGTANVVLTAQWKAVTAKYTVIFKDGETTLDTKLFEVGSNPSDADIDKTKPLFAFAAWQKDAADIALDDAFWATVVKDATVTLTARWTKAYATSYDMEAYAASVGASKAGLEAALTAANYAFTNINGIDNEHTHNYTYDGMKYKTNDGDLSFNVVAGKVVEVKTGHLPTNDAVTMYINGVADATVFEGADEASETHKTNYFYSAVEALYRLDVLASKGTCAVKAVTIRDPFTVSFEAHGDADPSALQGLPSVTLPDATNGTASLLGWFDAETGGNKIGDAGATYIPTANITLHAQWESISTDARLASITFSSAAGTLSPAFDPEVVNYTYTMPYGTAAVPTITGATSVSAKAQEPQIVSQASAWGETAVIRGVAESSDTKAYNITMKIAPKDGVCLVWADVPADNTLTYNATNSKFYAESDVTLQNSNVRGKDGSAPSGKKFQSNGFLKIALNEGTFLDGDVVALNVTYGTANVMHVFKAQAATSTDVIGEAAGNTDAGLNKVAITEDASTLWLVRGGEYADWNPHVDYVAVYRAMNPVLTAITIDGRAGVIDPLDDKHFNVQIPYEADLANLTIVPTIAWNAPAAENSIVVNDGGAWVEGNNTYKLTDKDGDYTIYTLTLTRDVLKHTVSFNTHGGSAVASELVVDGESLAAAPADPTKDDYLFQGWAETEDGSIVDVTSFTITADKEFHAVWVADGAIKLLDGSTVNHTNFITAVTADETVEFQGNTVNYAKFSGTCSGVNSVKDLTRVIAYNATTNKTKIRISAHNNSTSARNILVKGLVEGASAAVDLANIALGNKEDKISDWIEFDNAANRTIYIMVSSSAGDVYFTQVKVVESGETPMKQAGEAGYSLNLNKGRAFGKADDEVVFEGLNIELIGDYTALNSGNLKMNSSSISFAVAAPVTLNVTTANNKTYYVANSASGTDNETAFTGVSEFSLTAGTWFINAGDADVQLTNIAFSAPKCEKPAITAIADVDLCEGDAFTALVASASVSDGGTLHYAWFKEAGATDEAVGTDAASFTPDADGEYYVIVTNQLTGFADNTETSNVVTVQHLSGTTITTAPVSVRNDVDEMATLTVVAAGKNLSYKWYTCNADGSNAEVIAGEESDSYSVTITADMSQYYKVIVHGDCGDAEAIAKVEEWKELTQVDVAESTVWNWVNAGENNKLVSGKNVEILMANIRENDKIPTNDATFNSQALLFYGENVRAVEGGRAYASVGHISFNTTVPGVVVVEFSDNGSNNRRVSINGKLSESSATKTDVKTFSANVPAGDVTIMGVKDDGTGSNQYIRISKIEFVKVDYTRPVTAGRLGTICLPNGGKMYGAGLYEIAYFDATAKKIFFDEIINGEMIAGRPYIFLPNEGVDLLAVAYTDNADADAGNYKGLYGSYTQEELGTDGSNYILLNNQYCRVVEAHTYVGANRAYIKLGEIGTTPYAAAPGRRRISMGVTGENQAQGFENLQSGDQPMKVMIDGTLYIIRGEKVFDATGRLVK